MSELLLMITLIFMFISPKLFLLIQKKTWAIVNVVVLVVFAVPWILIIFGGGVGELQVLSVLWNISLFAGAILLLISFTSVALLKWHLAKKELIGIGILALLLIAFFFMFNELSIAAALDIFLSVTIPIYIIANSLVALFRYDRLSTVAHRAKF